MKPFVVVVLLLVLAAGCATRRTPAPVVDARAPKGAVPLIKPASGDYYVVQRGDTLYSIALEHGADHRELTEWNRLDDPTRLRVGQQLRVRPPAAAPAVPAAALRPAEPSAAQVGTARILGRVESRPLETLPPLRTRAPSRPEVALQPAKIEAVKPEPAKSAAAPGAAQFIWPVKGKVLAEFAEPRKKGIDIDGMPGAPVVASAPGRVTYIGSGIPGMGKLVVLKHDNGYITVYGHNRNILVKEQQAVARGQQIAELGSTDSERPKLHFQIRKGAAAVDPLLYLPR